MKFTIAREIEFVPEWNGNRDEDEPIKFTLKYLTAPERDEIVNMAFDVDGKVSVKPNFQKACKMGIKKIEGLTVDGKQITTANEFLGIPGFDDLYHELGNQIMVMNPIKDDNLKNSG